MTLGVKTSEELELSASFDSSFLTSTFDTVVVLPS